MNETKVNRFEELEKKKELRKMTAKKYSPFHRMIAAILSLVLVFSLAPTFVFAAETQSADRLGIVAGSKVADDPTSDDWIQYFGPNKMDTEFAGAVWTDKSVFTGESSLLPGVKLSNSNNFLVALSALAANYTITGHATVPTDTMLVLDLSGSMLIDEEYGPFQNGWMVDGIDVSNVAAMLDATNAAIDTLMTQNKNNRVGVILYSGNTSTGSAATASTATVILPLGRYDGVDANGKTEYLSLEATATTRYIYENLGTNRRPNWQPTDQQVTYYTGNVNVKVATGLKIEKGDEVEDASKRVNGGTYIQNGLYKALQEFLKVTDTVVPEGNAQAGAQRMPVLVLMSDGAPTIATTDYTNVGDSNVGSGNGTNDRITMLTQLTAAYVRGAIINHYKESSGDKQDMLFLTLGLGTNSNAAATDTLYPAGSDTDLSGYWDTYLAATAGNDITITIDDIDLTVERNALVSEMNYVDKYFYAADAEGMIHSFEEIVSEIQLKADTYNTLVSGGDADISGYITFEDELGELMEVYKVQGILMSDGNGGVVLYTGKGIAQGMTTGTLGTVDGATDRGNELVRTVKERIPGLTTSTAQQLINNAYNDQQLYYENDSNWSNYIGWYADADGNYVGFWDKDSGYENAPAGAVYANKSYGYLGVEGDSDMMHVVVQVRTNLKTKHQTVYFKIPAALIPTVTYNVTLDKDDTTKVESLTREDALPMQLVFEVGLRSDLNAVNLEAKIAEHVANGGHVHKNADGTYSFYTNSWAIGNDLNGNGIPDPNEVESAVVAESHFNPALDNGRFYFTEDTLVLDANGNVVTGNTKPAGTTYQHTRAIYNATEKTYIYMPMSAETVAKAKRNADGQWYIPAGSPYLEWSRFRFNKGENKTGTLGYTFVPAAFSNNISGIDIYAFLGNNGTLKLAPATGITLTKKVDGVIADAESYTFTVSVPAGVTANPIVTDANGDPIPGITTTAFANGSFDLTIPADVTAYITGIPAGTNVTITEKLLGDYHVSGITVNGINQAAGSSVQVTVPAVVDAVKINKVEFTNIANGYGDLTILKDVTHNLGTDPDVLATKVFTFRVTLSGDRVHTGDTFATSNNGPVQVAADGTLTFADGTPITLRNEESITIIGIPEGTAYTVVETDIPSGFAFDHATASTGIIERDTAAVASFVNRYPDTYTSVNVPLDLTVRKLLEGTPANEEIFRFALQQMLPDSTYPDQKVYEISSLAADKTVNDKSIVLQYANVGTYFYRIVEKIPDEKTPGMTYSATHALFAVVVTDTDMDGVLEVDVRAEANITASSTYADPADKETITGVIVEASFTNIYQVHSTSVSVGVHKDLTNNTGVEISLTNFQFGLYNVDASGNAIGAPVQVVTSSALGDATFNIIVAEDKDLTYIIKEIIPNPARPGMTYDAREYVLSIEVTAAMDGQLSAVSSVKLKGSNTETAAVFHNTYALTPASTAVPYSKTLIGRAPLEGETFMFQVVRTDDTYQPLTGVGAYSEVYTVPVGSYLFQVGQDLLNKVGTYHFKITELPGTSGGLHYDSTEYHIAITVTDNGNGALVASAPVIHKVGQAESVASADFVNTYSVTGSGSVVIDGKKTLSGRDIIAGEFTFGLYTDPNGAPIEIVTNRADGSFVFSALNFTEAHLDTGNGTKVYTYYVKEILPTGAAQGVTYDTTVHTVTVTVSHDNYGALVVTPSGNHTGSIVINNAYNAQGVDVKVHGMKLLVGDWSAVQNKTFSFQLYEADENYRVTNTTPIQVVSNSATGEFSFNLSFADGQEGNHYYVLREDVSAAAGGINYDATIYRVLVNVTDNGTGKLHALVSMYHPGTGNVANDTTLGAPVAVFSNGYSVEPVQVILEGKKILTGRDLAAGEFTFTVLEGTKAVATGTNAADGTITFTPITYAKPGVHTYIIQEDAGTLGGVTYDDTVFAVTVTVTDNGQGKLVTSVNYGTPVEFENIYTAEATDDVIFSGDKNLTGRELREGEFEFVLKNESGAAVETVKNAAGGKITFSAISFDKVGVYKYTISEVAGTLGGVTYDDSVFNVTVTVTDNGQGKLIADVQYSAPVVFGNAYKAAPSDDVVFGGSKVLNGRDLAAGEFEFVLKNESGATIETVKNAADGKFAFSGIRYDTIGTYKYTISEVVGTLGGVTYDDAVYTVIVTVVDWGTGKLATEVVYEIAGGAVAPEEVVFTNSYSADNTDEVAFSGNKVLTGRDLVEGEFQFVLKDETGATVETVKNTAGGKITFSSISFTKPGTYKYTISEVVGTLGGVTYDDSVFTVTVTVTDPGDGKLVADVQYSAPVVFNNTYAAAPSDEVTFGGSKDLTGRDLAAGEFQFVLKDASGKPIGNPVANDANGNFRFPTIGYDKTGVYKYTISEVAGNLGGVTYDSSVFTVTVTVTDPGDGKLVADVQYSAPVIFRNTYVAEKTDAVVFGGDKNLTGRDLAAGEFEFVLKNASGATVETVKNAAGGKFTFAGITFDAVGTYKYTISEVVGTLGGVTYDDSVFTVTVTVTDNGNGKLVADVQYSSPVVFNNSYKADKTNEVIFTGDKNLTGRDLAAGEFEFVLKNESGATIETVKNAAGGKFTFAGITFDAVGTYKYTISEVAGNLGGVTYDSTEFTVTVTVTDPGNGKLVADVQYSAPVVFNNTYKADKTNEVIFTGDKNLTGRDLAAGEFEFVLKNASGATIETVKNAADGKITFAGITFDAVGTYKYTISEAAGTLGGVTYDSTEFTVTVTVTDPGNGKLIADVQYSAPVVFTNKYVAEKTDEVIFTGDKNLTGRDLADGEFSFVLKDATGAVVELVKNDAKGKITFSGIAFERAGVHTYTISEVRGALGGVTYDDAVFTVTVTVTDPGDGKLVASVAYSAPVLFKNTYKAELVDFTFEADKHLVDISGGGRVNLAVPADLYEFLVKDTLNNVLATVKADVNGKIHFALPYTAIGTGHTFFLSEKAGTDEGITYDLSVYKVTYDLVDNGDGTITPENITIIRIKDAKGNDVTESATAMVFENTYRAPDATLDLFGQKHLNGGRDMVAGEFSFVLKDESGAEVEVVTNDANGVFFFKTLTFDTVGTYKFTISEVKGTDEKVTYDTTVYEITVTVTYENGVMKAVATVNGENVKEYGFTNIFTPDDVSVSIDVQKILENKTDKVIGLDGFAFQLKGQGNDTDKTIVSDEKGIAQFALTFTLEDIGKTFTYNLSEVAGDVPHMTYDETVYEIVITVTQDSTTGALELTVTRDGQAVTDSATFTNVFFEEPPKTSDAFQPALAAMMGIAAIGMLAVLVIGKKKFAE